MINTQKETETEHLCRLLRDAMDKAADAEEAITSCRTLTADLHDRWFDDFEPTEESVQAIRRDFGIIQAYLRSILANMGRAIEDVRSIIEGEGVTVCQ